MPMQHSPYFPPPLLSPGVYCWNWPVPLTQEGCLTAPKTVPRTSVAGTTTTALLGGAKRGGTATPGDGSASPMPAASDGAAASGGVPPGAGAPSLALAAMAAANSAKRQRTGAPDAPLLEELQGLSEAQLWSVAAAALQVGAARRGLAPQQG